MAWTAPIRDQLAWEVYVLNFMIKNIDGTNKLMLPNEDCPEEALTARLWETWTLLAQVDHPAEDTPYIVQEVRKFMTNWNNTIDPNLFVRRTLQSLPRFNLKPEE